MARKVRHSSLETRTARLKLAVRRKPYSGPSLARGVALLYRRNKTNGTWVLKASDGHGKYWTKAIAEADDHDESNGKTILNFFEAQDQAKKLARGEDGSTGNAPITVDGALKDYRRDLEARAANPYNADHPRLHLTSVLLAKPVALLTATELKKWRDGLLGAMAPATINRLCRCVCAALELARQHDERIQNRQAWETGLAGLPDAQEARNVIISDDKVREFVPPPTCMMTSSGCSSMCWPSLVHGRVKVVRLRVEDLHDHPVRPKLMMPKSAKGGGSNRSKKKHERYSVPITVQLAAKLREAAKGRADDAPLLTQSDGSAWGDNPGQRYHRAYRQDRRRNRARSCRGDDLRLAALKHRSDAAAELPIRLVASLHNTSVAMIERTYSKYITEHSDDISRKALLEHEEPQTVGADNVIALAS